MLWRSLVAYSGDREIASDAMAEAFAQAIARGDAIRDPTAWVWKVSFLLVRAELKRIAQIAGNQGPRCGRCLRRLPRRGRARVGGFPRRTVERYEIGARVSRRSSNGVHRARTGVPGVSRQRHRRAIRKRG